MFGFRSYVEGEAVEIKRDSLLRPIENVVTNLNLMLNQTAALMIVAALTLLWGGMAATKRPLNVLKCLQTPIKNVL